MRQPKTRGRWWDPRGWVDHTNMSCYDIWFWDQRVRYEDVIRPQTLSEAISEAAA